jgi:plastocyanin
VKKKTRPRKPEKADAEIHVIRIDEGGGPDRSKVTVDVGDQIHWVPTTTGVKIKIKFNETSAVGKKELPLIPLKGKVVKGTVPSSAAGQEHSYKVTGSRKRKRRMKKRATPGGDPIIIVR